MMCCPIVGRMEVTMAETWTSANRRRACVRCGESGANLYTLFSAAKPDGIPTRVCHVCDRAGFYDHVQLVPREPLYEERADTDPQSEALRRRPDQEPR